MEYLCLHSDVRLTRGGARWGHTVRVWALLADMLGEKLRPHVQGCNAAVPGLLGMNKTLASIPTKEQRTNKRVNPFESPSDPSAMGVEVTPIQMRKVRFTMVLQLGQGHRS